MGAHKETSPSRVDAALKATKVVQLRAAGATWSDAARAAGYSGPGTARAAVVRWLNRQPAEDRELMRQVEGLRLDRLQMAVWSRAINGDLQAIDRALKIISTRMEMFGLAAPTRVVIENGQLDEEIRELCAELGIADPRDLVEAAPVVEAPAIEGGSSES